MLYTGYIYTYILISIQVWLHVWGINASSDIVKMLNIDYIEHYFSILI